MDKKSWAGFEEFGQKKTISVDEPVVTISRDKILILNKKVAEYAGPTVTWIKFYFNHQKRLLAFQFRNEDDGTCYKARRIKGTIYTSPRRFLLYCGIDTSETRRYAAEWDEENRAVIVDLTKEPLKR